MTEKERTFDPAGELKTIHINIITPFLNNFFHIMKYKSQYTSESLKECQKFYFIFYFLGHYY